MKMDYPSNSNKANTANNDKKIPEKKVEKVVTGAVISKKKSTGSKFKSVFFGGEFKGAFRYILADVLLPAERTVTEAIFVPLRLYVFEIDSFLPERPSVPDQV
jgi:hypothetical protein